MILPNTTIGNNVIVGAGTVVACDIPDNSVVIGNPCKVICSCSEYLEKQEKRMKTLPVFDFAGRELNDDTKIYERALLIENRAGFFFNYRLKDSFFNLKKKVFDLKNSI